MAGRAVRALAPAKINLALHVTGKRGDGYHLLDSFVVFPTLGDVVEAETARTLSLTLEGPFAIGLPADGDNLVLRAATLLRPPGMGAALRLTKTLPVASGIGGGSSDAAATLRALAGLWDRPLPAPDATLALGADLPVCLAARPSRMAGVGERLSPLPPMPGFAMILANPGIPLATPSVFQALAQKANPPLAPLPPRFASFGDVIAYLTAQRNDLEGAALTLGPAVRDVLAALRRVEGAALVRMSGSGATCFALVPTLDLAERGADAIRARHPAWWVAASEVPAWAGALADKAL